MSNPFVPGTRLFQITETLLARDTPPLVPKGRWSAETTAAIEEAVSAEAASPTILAALHLLNDDLERAHLPAQQYEGEQTADYLHLLVHRREGDWSNAGYWMRRTGAHPLYAELLTTLSKDDMPEPIRGWDHWDAGAFIGLCQEADQGRTDPGAAAAISALSVMETAAVLGWCVRNPASAVSG